MFCLKLAKIAWCKYRWNVYAMYAVQLICTIFLLFLSELCSYKGMYFWYIWQTYVFYRFNKKKEFTKVEIQEQQQLLFIYFFLTAISRHIKAFLWRWKMNFSSNPWFLSSKWNNLCFIWINTIFKGLNQSCSFTSHAHK